MHISHLRTLAVVQLAELVAERRAQRGRGWLNRFAPPCWHRNFFEPLPGGTALFRGHTAYDNECPLALAFESQAHLANNGGYVTEAMVARHFNLSNRWMRAHGFGSLSDPVHVTNEMQDVAWSRLLRNTPGSGIAFRHRTAIDKRFAEMSFVDDVRPSFLGNFWQKWRAAWGV